MSRQLWKYWATYRHTDSQPPVEGWKAILVVKTTKCDKGAAGAPEEQGIDEAFKIQGNLYFAFNKLFFSSSFFCCCHHSLELLAFKCLVGDAAADCFSVRQGVRYSDHLSLTGILFWVPSFGVKTWIFGQIYAYLYIM